MKLNITTRVLFSNSFTWVLMSVVSFIAYQSINSMSETADWVEHTHQVIRNASKIEKLVVDMETGERGFLITGKKEFLEPYELGKKNLSKIIDETKKLVLDNPVQIENLKKINHSITFWHKEAGTPEIEKRREVNQLTSTMNDVVALIEKGKGKQIMDDIRDQLSHFKIVEEELMAERKLASSEEARFASYVIILGTFFIILFSHALSLLLNDAISKHVGLFKSIIKNMGIGVFPSKTEIESDNIFADLEKDFEKIAHKIISKAG
jgi:CHASE3 domain sensor protein